MDRYRALKASRPRSPRRRRTAKGFVDEVIETNKTKFAGLAIFPFNDQGRCYLCEPYHDSAKLTDD